MKKFIIISILSIYASVSITAIAETVEHGHNLHNSSLPQSIVTIMQSMNVNLGNLSKAIMTEDYNLITLSAHKIANHPSIIKEDKIKLFKRLGNEKAGFIKCDSAVHELALEIAIAGKQQNMDKILKKQSDMIEKAAECHQKYR